ncbi:MAG: hypothetical protein NC092_02615 [Butyrivibrio sp.]|nr:hypothetical protein [Muribaculum sp.]MCM1551566.1 hypothetical protein [Butyrivibrio sp.]
MGIFNFLNKISKKDNQAFYCAVDDTFSVNINNGNATVVVGNVRGKISMGDLIYISHPNGTVSSATVQGLEIHTPSGSQMVQSAKDCPTGILLNVKPTDIEKTAILSNTKE